MHQQSTANNKRWWIEGYSYLLNHPVFMLIGFLVVVLLALPGSRDFTFDASADTLVVQGDPELEFYRTILEHFGSDEFLLVTVAPTGGDVFAKDSLALIATLEAELEQLQGIRDVLSILDAPLLKSPPIPLTELAKGFKRLGDPGVDIELARAELLSSPLFRDLLISKDGANTALRIDLEPESDLEALRKLRDQLRAEKGNEKAAELAAVKARYATARSDFLSRRSQLMSDVRLIREKYQDQAVMYLGGVPVITSDMIRFVKSDIALFGTAILLAMLLVLYGFFREPIWVVLPLICAAWANLLLIGFLGYAGQAATIVSSNFVALLAITTVALNIHLIIRYRELRQAQPQDSHRSLVLATVRSKFAPCFYTALTTMVAFGSLLSSRILPVEDFGWIMVAGIAFSMFVTFTFFPALLLMLPPKGQPTNSGSHLLIESLIRLSIGSWRKLLWLSGAIALIALGGLTTLTLDNRFVDYFRTGTDIREGMLFIDQNLGGTLPFEVILSFPPWVASDTSASGEEEEDEFSDFLDEDEDETFPQKYWFTPDKLRRLTALHQYIDARVETGKTLSLSTLELIARDFTDGKPLDAVLLVGVLDAIPDSLREQFITPYAKPEAGLMRISSRIIESGPFFSRDQLIADIENYASEELGFKVDDKVREVRTTGAMVMFNDMLKRLLESQTSTIFYVVLVVLVMFLLLLRNVKLALIGLAPNLLAAATVLGIMGYVGLPLDIMTITIAAISVGIGVDNAIHYLYRYQLETSAGSSPSDAIRTVHRQVGPAMYYTSATVIIGFSILGLSNFIPNVTFGLLTALAMLLALFANLGLLPALLKGFWKSPPAQAPDGGGNST